ncbi:hypothetical protein V5P93_000483 [Actinokineospora auranticolor]|uniref:Copper(I)-binding protein n=1 Tax=Actinokineospora auranticolor TaxID=155976 RepID=A0A2S6GZN9_9PSEU|nr:hypothetical protein [Actinokineospora auranticolor]PPK70636.1 hypothetical protein CLV40_102554 [Actinokineospora auranticolor]
MSRAQQNSTGRLRRAPAALGLGLVAVLGAAACGSGQITQTDSQLPAVNGALAQSGQIALRDAMLAFPKGGHYEKGADAPLVLAIVNSGGTADKLLEVTSPVATEVEITGDAVLPGGFALAVGKPGEESGGKSVAPTTPTPTTTTTTSSAAATTTPSGSSSGAATTTTGSSSASSVAPTSSTPTTTTTTSKKVDLGKLEIVLKGLSDKLYPGKTVPVTFVFEKAGQITVGLPIAAPNGPREEHAAAEGGH